MCESDAHCIPARWKCDRDLDCADGSDEAGGHNCCELTFTFSALWALTGTLIVTFCFNRPGATKSGRTPLTLRPPPPSSFAHLTLDHPLILRRL